MPKAGSGGQGFTGGNTMAHSAAAPMIAVPPVRAAGPPVPGSGSAIWLAAILPDEAYSSSSDWNRNHAAKFARFNSAPKHANWSAGKNEGGEWLQIDLGEVKQISAVRVQGRFNHPQWVTRYNLGISSDLNSWINYENLQGASGQDDFSEFTLGNGISGRFVRFYPLQWHQHISMRVDVCAKK
jgi:contactin associated protein-like 2